MTDLNELTQAVAKADIAMKAAAWQLEKQTEDIAMLRKALLSWLMLLKKTAFIYQI
jgi:tRNA threonylcarbamoyladenosine modification (KEOPS) complex  Pcc1 subunit